MTKQFLMNVLLTFVWVMLSGNIGLPNFFFGYALGFGILYLTVRGDDNRKYFYRVPKTLRFALRFFYEMFKANLHVARGILKSTAEITPGIVKYPLDAKTEFEITMLSNVISLTPGTLVIDVSDDRKVMYIHAMYLDDSESFIKRTKETLENRLLEVMR